MKPENIDFVVISQEELKNPARHRQPPETLRKDQCTLEFIGTLKYPRLAKGEQLLP